MAVYHWVMLRNGSAHVVPETWFIGPKTPLRALIAWPAGVPPQERWRLARLRHRPSPDWTTINVGILASMDEYDNSEAEIAAMQRADDIFSGDTESEGGDIEGAALPNADYARSIFENDDELDQEAALFGSGDIGQAGPAHDYGYGESSPLDDLNDSADEPAAKRIKISLDSNRMHEAVDVGYVYEQQQCDTRAATAKLRLTVRMANDQDMDQSDLLADLTFRLAADTQDEITSEVVLEIMPKEGRVSVGDKGGVRPTVPRSCRVAWAKEVPRACVDDPKLRAVTREILAGDPPIYKCTCSAPMRMRSYSI